MTTQIVPTSTGLTRYEQTTKLGDDRFVLAFAWNQRESAWYLHVYDEDKDPIALGVKVVLNWPLLRSCADRRKPKGILMAIDKSGTLARPGLTDLGDRVVLCFMPQDDVDAVRAEAS